MLASIIYNYGKFCDDFKSTLKLGAYDLAAFEKLTNEKDLYSIHRPNSRKNVRIIYTIIDRKIIILLTVFLEKNKSDYQNAISVAKNRLKQLQE